MKRRANAGILSKEELEKIPGFPSKERLERGPVAVIECPENIPCNACEPACPKGHIRVGKPIVNLPVLDAEKCTGCGLCIPACPGLAIFVVNAGFSKKEALVSIPHEFLPLPRVGSIVNVVDRRGKVIAKGRVIRVREEKDHTAVISLAVPKKFASDIRGISVDTNDIL